MASFLFYLSVSKVISIKHHGRNLCQQWLQYNHDQDLDLFGHQFNGEFDQSEQNCEFQHEINQDLPNLLQQVR